MSSSVEECINSMSINNYYNNYACYGTTKRCQDSASQSICESQPGCTWHGTYCDGTAKSCSERDYTNGDVCGNPSTTGCTAYWSKGDIFVKIFKVDTSWEGIPVFLSSRGPAAQSSSLTKPLVTAPGFHICAARAFEGQDQSLWTEDCGIADYVSGSGTSMATPMVAGTVALLLQASPTASRDNIMKSLANADQKIFKGNPNFEEGYGRVNAQKAINNITNCKLYRDGGHLDSDKPKCMSNFDMTESVNQMRTYFWSNIFGDCDCNVNYDSSIDKVSVNGQNYVDDVCVNRTDNIVVDVSVTNSGIYQQNSWYLGVEFWNVSDYTLVHQGGSYEQYRSGRINAFYNGGDGSYGCVANPDPVHGPIGSCPSGVDCRILSESKIANGILDVGETITVRCQAPASFYPVSTGNNRIMFWIHERDTSQDANGNGIAGEWWWDALSNVESTAPRVKIYYPTNTCPLVKKGSPGCSGVRCFRI
jgi:hypothetical protein